MEQITTKQRIREFVKYERISVSDFCRSIDVSVSFVSSMRNSMQPDKIDRIALKYPNLNIEWLLTGQGSMIKSEVKPEGVIIPLPDAGALERKQIIEAKNEQIKELKKDLKEMTEIAAVLKYRLDLLKETGKEVDEVKKQGESKDVV